MVLFVCRSFLLRVIFFVVQQKEERKSRRRIAVRSKERRKMNRSPASTRALITRNAILPRGICHQNAFSFVRLTHHGETAIGHSQHHSQHHGARKKDIFETRTTEEWKQFFEGRQEFGILKRLDFKIVTIEHKKLVGKVHVQEDLHMTPHGYMHAAAQVFLADTGMFHMFLIRHKSDRRYVCEWWNSTHLIWLFN